MTVQLELLRVLFGSFSCSAGVHAELLSICFGYSRLSLTAISNFNLSKLTRPLCRWCNSDKLPDMSLCGADLLKLCWVSVSYYSCYSKHRGRGTFSEQEMLIALISDPELQDC